jgi:hypothetical protein
LIRPSRTLPALGLLVVVSLLTGACAPAVGPLGTPATPLLATQPTVENPTQDATPGTPPPTEASATSPGASDSPGATAVPASAPVASPTPAGGTMTVRAYFIMAGIPNADGSAKEGLAPVLRQVPTSQAVATAAMIALLAGPSPSEAASDPGIRTVIPAGTRLLGLSITAGVATVNLSAEFESGGGSTSIFGRLAQVVYTLTQFPTIKTVLFLLDGRAVSVFSGEGVILDHAVGRDDYTDQRSPIFVDRPAWGAAIGNPAHVAGLADVFEAQFRVQLLDADGAVNADSPVMASCGSGCWGTFAIDLPYSVAEAQYGTLRAFDSSAKDGSPVDVVTYRVWLTPAG